MQTIPMPQNIMTMAELKEYKSLQSAISGGNSFTVIDFDNPEHVRLNELADKYIKLRQHFTKN
jgi:hypothetical protein